MALAIYAGVLTLILAGFLIRYPIPELLPKVASLLSALWYVFALHATGRFLRAALQKRLPRSTDLTTWELRLTDGAIGMSVVGFLVILLGWAVPGALGFKLHLLFGLLVSASAADAFLWWERRRSRPRAATDWQMPPWVAAVIGAGSIAAFLSCFSPITHYDSLVYHLALPALYLREGSIGAVPFNLYSFFPAAAEMNFLLILGALPAPEYVINLVGWVLAVALGGAVSGWSRTLGGEEQSWMASFIWWTAPLVLLLSQGAYVDLPLAALTFLSVRWFVAARNGGGNHALALAGFLAGAAFAVKYTGGLTAIVLFASLVLMVANKSASRRALFYFTFPALICPSPWLIKNLALAGNPFFPFFYKLFGGNVGWTAATADGYFRMLTEYGARSNVLFDLFATLWGAGGTASRGGFDVLGDFGWPIVLFAAPLAFFFRRGNKDIAFLSAYALVHAGAWYFSKPVLRFLIGIFPLGVVLASFALRTLISEKGTWTRRITFALLIPWVISNVFMYGLAAGELRLFDVPFGKSTPHAFLGRLAFYPTFEAINAGLGAGQRALLIGEQRTYHLKVPFIASNLFAPSPIADFCNHEPRPSEISQKLSDMDVSVIILSEAEIKRLGGLKSFGFTGPGESAFRQFLAEETIVMSDDRGVQLREIRTSYPTEIG